MEAKSQMGNAACCHVWEARSGPSVPALLGWEEALVALSRVSVGKSRCVVVILRITTALSLPV